MCRLLTCKCVMWAMWWCISPAWCSMSCGDLPTLPSSTLGRQRGHDAGVVKGCRGKGNEVWYPKEIRRGVVDAKPFQAQRSISVFHRFLFKIAFPRLDLGRRVPYGGSTLDSIYTSHTEYAKNCLLGNWKQYTYNVKRKREKEQGI